MFEIHSIGDSAFLAQILNAVAMITGTGDFVQLCSIGILLGVVIICVQTVLNASKSLDFQQILVGWVCWMCFFGVSTTVTIEDAYTGEVRVVDNVPIGVGFAGSMISNIGYGITDLFETAYRNVASMTNEPFAESLRVISTVRQKSYDASVLDAVNQSVPGTDIQRSLENYMRDCTMVKIQTGAARLEDVYTQEINSAIKFDSKVFGTRIFTANGAADLAPSCAEAWTRLSQVMDESMQSAQVISAVNRISGVRDEVGIPQTTTALENSLTMLGVQADSAQEFVKATIIEPIYRNAARGYYSNANDPTYALMVGQAISQRNTQWAAEQSMFMTTVRPMLTFFEGFIFAITPVVGFLMVIGTFGLMLAVRYFQVILWIQLWFPVMSVCNLYITMAATGQIQSMGGQVASFYGLNAVNQILETWLATGGMLCAATPMIALFLVTGSTYAFTTLANRMQGGDHVNEKVASPDAIQTGPVHMQEAMATGNQNITTKMSGGDSVYKQLSHSKAFNDTVASTATNMQTAQTSFTQALNNAAQSGMTKTDQASYERSLGRSMATSKDTSMRTAYDKVRSYGESHGWSSDQIDQVAGQMRMAAQGSVGANAGINLNRVFSTAASAIDKAVQKAKALGTDIVPSGDKSHDSGSSHTQTAMKTIGDKISDERGIGVNAGLNGSLSFEGQNSHSHADGSRSSVESGATNTKLFSESESASFKKAAQMGLSQKETQSLAKTFATSENKSLQKAANSVLSSTEQYQQAVSMANSSQANTVQSSLEVGSRINRNSQASEALEDAYKSHRYDSVNGKSFDQHINDRMAVMRRNGSADEKANRAAAIMEYLYDNGHSKEYTNILSKEMGTNFYTHGDANRNEGIQSQTFEDPNSKHLNGPQDRTGSDFSSNISKTHDDVSHGSGIISDAHARHEKETKQQDRQNNAVISEQQKANAMQQMAIDAGSSRWAQGMGASFGLSDDQLEQNMRTNGLTDAQIQMAKAQNVDWNIVTPNDRKEMQAAYDAMYRENSNVNPNMSEAELHNLTTLQANAIAESVKLGDKSNTALTGLRAWNQAAGMRREMNLKDASQTVALSDKSTEVNTAGVNFSGEIGRNESKVDK